MQDLFSRSSDSTRCDNGAGAAVDSDRLRTDVEHPTSRGRRRILIAMGGSVALAGLSGCTVIKTALTFTLDAAKLLISSFDVVADEQRGIVAAAHGMDSVVATYGLRNTTAYPVSGDVMVSVISQSAHDPNASVVVNRVRLPVRLNGFDESEFAVPTSVVPAADTVYLLTVQTRSDQRSGSVRRAS